MVNGVDICYLECQLSRTFIFLNYFFGPFNTLGNCPNKLVVYPEPCYLELSLCRTISSVYSALFRAVFHPLSWTFSFYSFECRNNTLKNFDRMLIFSSFNTTTCWKQSGILPFEKCKSIKCYILNLLLLLNYLPLVSQCTKYNINFNPIFKSLKIQDFEHTLNITICC